MKKNLSLLIMGMVILPMMVVCQPHGIHMTAQSDKQTDTPLSHRGVLYEQLGNPSGTGIVSQDFPDSPTYNSQGADDFLVPDGETWLIEEIIVPGFYHQGVGPALEAHVFVYEHDPAINMPGGVLFEFLNQPVSSTPEGVLTINLTSIITTTPLMLTSGHYWISVQAHMEFTGNGQWMWRKQLAPTINNEMAWRNPGGGFGIPGGENWQSSSALWPTHADHNLSFGLYGTLDGVVCPEVFAGEDVTINANEFYHIQDAMAINYSELMWTSSGDGEFDDPLRIDPLYFHGPLDAATGEVTLCITAQPIPPCPDPATDCLVLTIIEPAQTLVHGTVENESGEPPVSDDLEIIAFSWCNADDQLSTTDGTIEYWIDDGVGHYQFNYMSFANPPIPGDMIHLHMVNNETLEFAAEVVELGNLSFPVIHNVQLVGGITVKLIGEGASHKVTIPRLSSLIIDFTRVDGCGNISVYKGGPTVWYRYRKWGHNTVDTTKYIRNGTYGELYPEEITILSNQNSGPDPDNPREIHLKLTATLVNYSTSPGDDGQTDWPSVHAGWRDGFSCELGHINGPTHEYMYGDGSMPKDFPRQLGSTGVQQLEVNFQSSDAVYWEDLELTVDILNVIQPGTLNVNLPGSTIPGHAVFIEPDQAQVRLPMGGITTPGYHTLTLTAAGGLEFEFDCFNLSSTLVPVQPELFMVKFHVIDQDGDALQGALVEIDDFASAITDEFGEASFDLENGEYIAHISKEGYDAEVIGFVVENADLFLDVVLNQSPTSALDDLRLVVGDWLIAEPWHRWIDGRPGEVTHVQLHCHDPLGEILQVDFEYNFNNTEWIWFDSDLDGEKCLVSPYVSCDPDADGWSGKFTVPDLTESVMSAFRAVVTLQNGEMFYVDSFFDVFVDIDPPSAFELNIQDFQIIELDEFTLEIIPSGANIDSVRVVVEKKPNEFAKGIGNLSQLKPCRTGLEQGGDHHCVPTAAAACLKYFADSANDQSIMGGLTADQLVDKLAELAKTNVGGYGTWPKDMAEALSSWLEQHGDNYTVRRPFSKDKIWNEKHWKKVRNELERSQDVLMTIKWDGGGAHMMTFNSIVNKPLPGKKIKVDFMDPWTGKIEYGELDPKSGHMTNYTDSLWSGTFYPPWVIIVCPKETKKLDTGGITRPGPSPSPIQIPLPDPGFYWIRVEVTDDDGGKSRDDFVLLRPDPLGMDFGDAPAPYPTLFADNGARHIINPDVYLGELIDAEPDGQPCPNALGDDLNNLPDEDGVAFMGPLVAGKTATIKVKASVDGYLNAWLDFNMNGSWADAGDQIFADQPLAPGINSLSFDIPAGIDPGATFARFRFDTQGNLSYEGVAIDGEVEDYKVIILPESWGYTPTGSTHIVAVPATLSLNCVSLSTGDFIGVFYTDDSGELACGGAIMWDGVNNHALAAFGNDNTTTEKDGFDEGEEFIWKIYKTGSASEEEVMAAYDPTLPDAEGKFFTDGLSALTGLSNLMQITVTADPLSVCEGDEVQLSVLVAGGCGAITYYWYSDPAGFTSDMPNPTDTPTETTTYFVTVTDDTGNAITDFVTVEVLTSPTIICPDDFTMCALDAPLDLMTLVSPQGGSFTGGQIFYPANAPIGVPLQITYTYTDPQTGCSASCVFYITVHPNPTVVCPDDFTMCANDAPIDLMTLVSPQGGSFIGGQWFDPSTVPPGLKQFKYTYTDPQTGCSATCIFYITVYPKPTVTCPPDTTVCLNDPSFDLSGGSPSGGEYFMNGNVTTTFEPLNAGVGDHTITYLYTDANGCSATCTFTVTVLPLPDVTCPPDIVVCVDGQSFTLTGGLPAGGEYSFNGTIITEFDPGQAGDGDHIITYTYTDPQTGCSKSCTFEVKVEPLPAVTCPPDMSVCENDAQFALTGATPPNGVYSGNGVSGGQFSPLAAGIGDHEITYTYTDPVTGCSNSCTFWIIVHPLPVVTCPPPLSVCEDDQPFMLAGAMPPGGTYSGNGVNAAGEFDPVIAGIGGHIITYTYTDPATGCTNSCNFTITVIALPVVTCPPLMSVCVDDAPFTLTGATPAGGSYLFNGNPITVFDPGMAGDGLHTIFYSYTDPLTGCTNVCPFTITVHPLPNVNCPADIVVCANDPQFILTGATPSGGKYYLNGIEVTSFNPAQAGAGNHLITYHYTDPQTGCSNSCVFTIIVHALPQVACPPDINVCENDQPFNLAGATPPGGFYLLNGNVITQFNPAVAGVGNHLITYTYADPQTGCSNSCDFTIIVHALPQVACPPDMIVCENDPPFNLTGATPAGGTYSGNGVSGGVFSPQVAGQGNHMITYTYTEAISGCSNSCMFMITVIPGHSIDILQGWSGISSSIIPNNPLLDVMLNPIAGELIIMQNFSGVYWPAGSMNTLINWDEYSGYAIKVTDDVNLSICGAEVTDKTVDLNAGWNLIPVLSTNPVDIVDLFSGVNGFQIAKDVAGTGIYWPMFGINTIGNVLPGKAYFVRMTAPGVIDYALHSKSRTDVSVVDVNDLSTPWNKITATPASHLVVFNLNDNPLMHGDIIGAFTVGDICAGIALVDDPSIPFALTVHGADPYSSQKDGFDAEEPITLKVYRPASGELFAIEAQYNPAMAPSNFQIHGLSEVTAVKTEAATTADLAGESFHIYPNPAKGFITIAGIEDMVDVLIFNAHGKTVVQSTLMLPAKIDLSAQPKGLYMIKISTSSGVFFEKLILN